jgi:hypothetical protein
LNTKFSYEYSPPLFKRYILPYYQRTTKELRAAGKFTTSHWDGRVSLLLPIMKDDFVDVCLKIIEGRLRGIEFEKMASVVTYKVPMTYGGYRSEYAGDNIIDLSEAEGLEKVHGSHFRLYPASVEPEGWRDVMRSDRGPSPSSAGSCPRSRLFWTYQRPWIYRLSWTYRRS